MNKKDISKAIKGNSKIIPLTPHGITSQNPKWREWANSLENYNPSHKSVDKKKMKDVVENDLDENPDSSFINGYNEGIKKAIKIVDNEFMYYLQQEVIILKLKNELKGKGLLEDNDDN